MISCLAHEITQSQSVQTHLDVVFCPVDTTHCQSQSTHATLIHVTGNGAAEA